MSTKNVARIPEVIIELWLYFIFFLSSVRYWGLSEGRPLMANAPRKNGLNTSRTVCVLRAEFCKSWKRIIPRQSVNGRVNSRADSTENVSTSVARLICVKKNGRFAIMSSEGRYVFRNQLTWCKNYAKLIASDCRRLYLRVDTASMRHYQLESRLFSRT